MLCWACEQCLGGQHQLVGVSVRTTQELNAKIHKEKIAVILGGSCCLTINEIYTYATYIMTSNRDG